METDFDLPAPIAYGKQDFAGVRSSNSVYVDKTGFIIRFMKQPANAYFFLSRPRRFGKSLFLSTLKEAFSGNRELFKGLALYDAMPETWEKYPIIHLDFSVQSTGIRFDIDSYINQLIRTVYEAGLRLVKEGIFPEIQKEDLDTFDLENPANYLKDLIYYLYERTGKQVIILVDEYDSAITASLEKKQHTEEITDLLRPFFQVMKSNGQYLRFIFVTGISRFARLSLFSSMNQINDITMHPDFNALCGYTEAEVKHYFSAHLEAFAKQMSISQELATDRIRFWYNGYRWGANERVYNPVSIGKVMENYQFKPYWVETGSTPRFLYNQLKKSEQTWIDITDNTYDLSFLDSFDLNKLTPVSLLWQTGYLSINQEYRDEDTFQLSHTFKFPNFEVESTFKEQLLEDLLIPGVNSANTWGKVLTKSITENNPQQFGEYCIELIRSLGYHAHTDARRRNYAESFYQMVILTALTCIGIGNQEMYNYKGRKDLTITYQNRVWIVEIKHAHQGTTAETLAVKALDQIEKQDYASGLSKPADEIIAIGIGILGQAEDVVVDTKVLKH